MKLKKLFNNFTKIIEKEIELISVLIPMVTALFMAFNIFCYQLTPYIYETICLILGFVFSLVAVAYSNSDKQNEQLN